MPAGLIRPEICRWAWLGLIALQVAWFAWLHPPVRLPVPVALVIATVPLLLPAPWILKLHYKALILGGGILVFHFTYAVGEAWASPPVRIPACLQILLVALYFTGLMARYRRVEGR